MATNRRVRTIVVSMVVALLALSFLALSASASARVTPGGSVAASAACSAAMPSSSIETTAASTKLVFHPDQLSVEKSAIGGMVCIKNLTAQAAAVGYHNGQAIGSLSPNQASIFAVAEEEANGTTVLSLMPQRAVGPTLTISFHGASSGRSDAAACSAAQALPYASLTKTAIGQWVFEPARLSVKRSAVGAAICIRNASAQAAAVGYAHCQAIGSLSPNQASIFVVKEEEANGTTVLSLMPQRAAGPTLTLVFE